MKGKLISISGLDGAGKSTQIGVLKNNLIEKGYRCDYFMFDATHYGSKAMEEVERLRSNDVIFTRLCIDWTERYPLMKDFVYNPELQIPEIALAVTAIFAGGCIQVYESCLKPMIEKGIHIVCDRFWLDDIVYRKFWVDENIIRLLYKNIPRPDLPLFLNTSPELVQNRNKSRIDGKSPLMQKVDSINMIRNSFLELSETESMTVINGNRPQEAIAKEIFEHVMKVISF